MSYGLTEQQFPWIQGAEGKYENINHKDIKHVIIFGDLWSKWVYSPKPTKPTKPTKTKKHPPFTQQIIMDTPDDINNTKVFLQNLIYNGTVKVVFISQPMAETAGAIQGGDGKHYFKNSFKDIRNYLKNIIKLDENSIRKIYIITDENYYYKDDISLSGKNEHLRQIKDFIKDAKYIFFDNNKNVIDFAKNKTRQGDGSGVARQTEYTPFTALENSYIKKSILDCEPYVKLFIDNKPIDADAPSTVATVATVDAATATNVVAATTVAPSTDTNVTVVAASPVATVDAAATSSAPESDPNKIVLIQLKTLIEKNKIKNIADCKKAIHDALSTG